VVDRPGREAVEGRLFNLEARFAGSRVWLGPGWAFLCGAVASGGLRIDWRTLISLLLGLVLVDSLLGSAWSTVASRRWESTARKRGNPGARRLPMAVPYTSPGSVSYRFFGFLGRRIAHWRSTVWPQHGAALVSLLFGSCCALVVAAVLGPGALILTGFALALAAVRLVASPLRQGLDLALGSTVLGGVAWLIGYVGFGDFVWLSVAPESAARPLVWAAMYAAAFHGYQLLGVGDLVRGGRLVVLAQIAAIVVLIVVKQPILAAGVGLLLLPQMLLQPSLLKSGDGLWYMRRVQVFALSAMMVAAVAAAT
jgi:hypothetical protein